MVRLAQLTSVGWIKRSGHSSLRAHRRPAFGYVIDVDQLLKAPRSDSYGENDLAAIRAFGIPVIADVPPIVIITPAQREKHPLDAASRRRAR
jgi:hypothetical protein